MFLCAPGCNKGLSTTLTGYSSRDALSSRWWEFQTPTPDIYCWVQPNWTWRHQISDDSIDRSMSTPAKFSLHFGKDFPSHLKIYEPFYWNIDIKINVSEMYIYSITQSTPLGTSRQRSWQITLWAWLSSRLRQQSLLSCGLSLNYWISVEEYQKM